MIQHVWSVLCQSASIDSQTNSVSLLNVVDTIMTNVQPVEEKAIFVSMEILSTWAREDESMPVVGESRVLLLHKGKTIIEPIILEINLLNSIFHRNRVTIGSLPLTMIGRYEFRIECKEKDQTDWRLAAIIPFFVSLKS